MMSLRNLESTTRATRDTCKWRRNDDFVIGYWLSACGFSWGGVAGGFPSERGVEYCPRCGGKIDPEPIDRYEQRDFDNP